MRPLSCLVLLALLVPLAALAAASDPAPVRDATGDPPPVAVDDGAVAPDASAVAPSAATPLMTAIRQLWEERQARLADLAAQFATATDPSAALAAQREIEALQLATELDIMRLQAGRARDEGREADAALLEAAIAEALAPAPPAAPSARPRPAGRDGR